MIPEELFGKIIKYHLLDQEQEADDIRKGLEKKLDAMVNREVYSKFKTAPTEEERALEEKRRMEQMPKGSVLKQLEWATQKSQIENQQRKKNKTKYKGLEI